MAGLLAPLFWVAGAAPTRRAVNGGFHLYARRRVAALERLDPIATQARQLQSLVRVARDTRFGRDHQFRSIRNVADFQKAVPLRAYEELWRLYLRDAYPVFDNLTWPGRIPYLALTSGTTLGATKYIPISRAMVGSNLKASKSMIACHLQRNPGSRLFHGKFFFLGGSTDLERPAPDVAQGDLSGIASLEVTPLLRPYTFPPLELALIPDWQRKLELLAQRSIQEPITLVSGVPSWLLMLFRKVLELTGRERLAEVWPSLEVIVHGGVKFDPYRASFEDLCAGSSIRLQETYPCSEGFVAFGEPDSQSLRLLVDHGLFYEFVPVDELDSPQPTRHWLGTVEPGINYAIVVSTCAGLWSHVIGDTVRFDSVRPPRIQFTGRTKYTLSAFGEHLINEEVERAIAAASAATAAHVCDWHVGPVFQGSLGYHRYLVEFQVPPDDLSAFRQTLDSQLCAANADYQAHRAPGVGMPLPALSQVRPGGFADWMRSVGKLGGQHKLPRMDNSGTLTTIIHDYLRGHDAIVRELDPEATGVPS